MRILIKIVILLGITLPLHAQGEYQMKSNNTYAEIDFLTSYYEQDGNNSPVTGGEGTEALADVSSIFVVNIPLDSTKSITGTFGADYYTSASTDNIDSNPSSASSKDIRAYASIGYNQKKLNSGLTYGVRLGFSTEYDYTSVNGGIHISKEFNEGNTEISFSGQAFVDQWSLYFPSELRGKVDVPSTSRNSYNGQFTFSQIINKKMQFAISAEAIYMEGLLSTPFHRVYFDDVILPDIERLPSSRLKLPFSIRATYFPLEKVVIRSYYRFYTDDFGIAGHTASIETPIKINDFLTLIPFYRYHTQTAADYFAPFAAHLSSEEFYTSDYDLSDLSSGKFGLGIGYSPLYGLARTKLPFTKKVFMLNSINLRGSYYNRSTGLTGFSVALELNMRI